MINVTVLIFGSITSSLFVILNDLKFAVLLHAPGIMVDGNFTVGLIVDDRATSEQHQALVAIASGEAGGPMAGLEPLISTFAGAEAKPIHFEKDGLSYASSIPDVLDHAVEGVAGANPDEPLYIDNCLHPVNTRLALAKATHSHLHAFGIEWDDTSGNNNGHFAPFDWWS